MKADNSQCTYICFYGHLENIVESGVIYHHTNNKHVIPWFILYPYQAINRLSKGSLSTGVVSMRTKKFDKCIKNKMEEDIRKELKEIREEFMELNQKVTECSTAIADNRKKIYGINDRHIPLNIRSKLCCLFNLNKITYLMGGGGRDNKSLKRSCMGLCQKSFKIPKE